MQIPQEKELWGKLKSILDRAFKQASEGKGRERHGNGLPFEEQPMQTMASLLGTNHGMLFQAMKKIQESTRMDADKATHELLGAIVYVAGAVVFLEDRHKESIEKKEIVYEMAFNRLPTLEDIAGSLMHVRSCFNAGDNVKIDVKTPQNRIQVEYCVPRDSGGEYLGAKYIQQRLSENNQ